jgi:HK97 gp10 family phage protein
VSTIGFDDLAAKFRQASALVQDEVAREVAAAAADYEAAVIRDIPINNGTLKGSVHKAQEGPTEWDVYVGAYYAPFLEFGTKGHYTPIPGFEDVAAQFKGFKRGDYYDFLNNILDWVKKKGFADTYDITARYVSTREGRRKSRGSKAYNERLVSLAEAIAWSIIRKGIKPQPFFYKQIGVVTPKFRERLQTVLNRVVN